MEIILSETILSTMLQDAAEIGASAAMSKAGLLKPYLSKQEAYNLHGRTNVDRWIKEGLITPKKDGGTSAKFRIDRVQVEAVAKANNRPSYLSVNLRA